MGNRKKLKVAITGSIGSGKSTFADFLKKQGYPVIFADKLSKKILASDSEVKKKIVRRFGSEAYQGGKINKKLLAGEIFSDPEKLRIINSILHPVVRRKINELAADFFLKHDIVFVEAALIFESKIEKMYDFVVLVSADEKIREERSFRSKKFSKADFRKRNRTQMKENKKIKKADFVFYNNETKKKLQQKALLLISVLKACLQ